MRLIRYNEVNIWHLMLLISIFIKYIIFYYLKAMSPQERMNFVVMDIVQLLQNIPLLFQIVFIFLQDCWTNKQLSLLVYSLNVQIYEVDDTLTISTWHTWGFESDQADECHWLIFWKFKSFIPWRLLCKR